MSGLTDFLNVQPASDGVSWNRRIAHKDSAGFVKRASTHDPSLTRAHWLAKDEGDAEGVEWHSFSPFYTYNITPGGVKVKDLVVKRMSGDGLRKEDKTSEQDSVKLDHQSHELRRYQV